MKSGLTKKRLVWVVAALCVVILALAATFWPGEKEPEYQGKKLSQWLDAYPSLFGKTTADATQAAGAVRHMGTNALPFLVKWIRTGTPTRKARLAESLDKPLFAGRREAISRFLLQGDIRTERALKGFEIMGEQANDSVGELTRIMNESRRREISQIAICALVNIGDRGAICVLSAITNQMSRPRVRRDAVNAVLAINGLIREKAAILYCCIENRGTPPEVRETALVALAYLENETNKKFPPVLGFEKLLKDASPVVRMETTNLLGKIAPELLTNGVSGKHE